MSVVAPNKLHLDLVQRHTPSVVLVVNNVSSWGPSVFQVPH